MVPVANWLSLPPRLPSVPWTLQDSSSVSWYSRWSWIVCWPTFLVKPVILICLSFLFSVKYSSPLPLTFPLVSLLFLSYCQISSSVTHTLCLSMKSSLKPLWTFKEFTVPTLSYYTAHESSPLLCIPSAPSSYKHKGQGDMESWGIIFSVVTLNREVCLKMQGTGPNVPGNTLTRWHIWYYSMWKFP